MKGKDRRPSNYVEVNHMNDMQRQQIKELRETGHSYGRIAQRLGLSENTIKTYCKRHGLGGVAKGIDYRFRTAGN